MVLLSNFKQWGANSIRYLLTENNILRAIFRLTDLGTYSYVSQKYFVIFM